MRRRVTVLHRSSSGPRLVVKGAPEAVLPRCQLDDGDIERFDRVADEWGRHGLRILAVAERDLADEAEPLKTAEESLAAVGPSASKTRSGKRYRTRSKWPTTRGST